MNNSLLETVRILERRAENLEKEAMLLRQDLAKIAEELTISSPVVARYVIEGETYEITQTDVDALRARVIKPRSDRTLHTLILAEKMAQRLQHLSPEEKSLLSLCGKR
jgi:hypothetical protein